jgi:hypothetical protein
LQSQETEKEKEHTPRPNQNSYQGAAGRGGDTQKNQKGQAVSSPKKKEKYPKQGNQAQPKEGHQEIALKSQLEAESQ